MHDIHTHTSPWVMYTTAPLGTCSTVHPHLWPSSKRSLWISYREYRALKFRGHTASLYHLNVRLLVIITMLMCRTALKVGETTMTWLMFVKKEGNAMLLLCIFKHMVTMWPASCVMELQLVQSSQSSTWLVSHMQTGQGCSQRWHHRHHYPSPCPSRQGFDYL